MPTIPCPIRADCLGTDTPFANLSSEAPDYDQFIGFNWGWGNNRPPLGSYWLSTGCLGTCVSAESQEDADLCAAAQWILCQKDNWNNPGGSGNGYQPPVDDPMDVFTSTTQTCAALCPDGLYSYYTVLPGKFTAFTQQEADDLAYAYACQQVLANKVCIGDLSNDDCCVGEDFGALIACTTSHAPLTFSVHSGQLPPGITLSQYDNVTALLTGRATDHGSYQFTIQAIDTQRDFMRKTFTIHCLEITSDTPLPETRIFRTYSEQLTTEGGSGNYQYRVLFGTLPLGLALSSSGLISGTCEDPGGYAEVNYAFTIIVTDLDFGISCTKDFSILVRQPAPDWDSVGWSNVGDVAGLPAGSADANAAGGSFTGDCTGPTGGGQISRAYGLGTGSYRGPIAPCRLTISVPHADDLGVGGGNVGCHIYLGATHVLYTNIGGYTGPNPAGPPYVCKFNSAGSWVFNFNMPAAAVDTPFTIIGIINPIGTDPASSFVAAVAVSKHNEATISFESL